MISGVVVVVAVAVEEAAWMMLMMKFHITKKQHKVAVDMMMSPRLFVFFFPLFSLADLHVVVTRGVREEQEAQGVVKPKSK